MAAAVEQENAEILPLDRYIRAVTICNNLALLASQGSVAQFFQRIAVLSRLQRYWTKGFDTVELSCAEVDALPPDTDEDDDDACGLASLVPVSSAADWDARSDSTVDLKPDISSVVTDVSEAVDVHLALEQNDGAKDDGDEEYRLPAKKHRRRKVKRFSCQQCGEKFTYRYQLTRHENRSHKQAPGDAAAADAVPASGEEMNGVVFDVPGMSDGRTITCAVCEQDFTSSRELQQHDCIRACIAVAEQKGSSSYCCGVCRRGFIRLEDYRKHLHLHTGKASHVCMSCGKRFRNRSSLLVHMRRHTGERPYSCRVCGRQFSQHGSLNVHERIHTDARPHVCAVCGRGFIQRSLLRYHMRVHTQERPYACTMCGKAFRNYHLWNLHQRVHTGDKPVVCERCPARFKSRSALGRHMRTHSAISHCYCNVCGKGFSQRSNLRTHMRVHTGERPFICKICGQQFAHNSSLKKHVIGHRGGGDTAFSAACSVAQ